MLRVMTWNILTGGRDRHDPSRLDQVIQVVTEQRPDILAVQELRDFRREGRMERFAAAVGMHGYLAREWFGQPVAVLVRPPGRVSSVTPLRRPFHHAAQRVVVPTDAGPLTVLSAHLNPYSGGRRLREAGWLAAACRGTPDRLVLLMGDLNSLDPWADHTARIERLPVPYRTRHVRPGTSEVDTRVVAALDRVGLVDLFHTSGSGPGETAPTSGIGAAEFSGMRLDYLFGSPALAERVLDCRVVRGGAVEYASDHYPVIADLDLSLG